MARMVARDAAWCSHFGTHGKSKDKERRLIKRSERNVTKREIRKELASRD